jgi:O-acetylserine/cysteine efflux transporter
MAVLQAPAALDRTGLVLLGISVVLLSAAWPVTKYGLDEGAAPMWFAEGRAALSAVTGTVILVAMRRVRRPARRDLPTILGVGLFQLAGFFALAHAAVAWVPAGRTAVLSNVTTIWMVPLSLLVLHEPMPARRWVAAAIGLLGVVVLVGPWAIDWQSRPVLIGHAFLLGAGLSWSIAIVIMRRWVPRLAMLELLPWCFGLAAIALLPLMLLHGGPGRWTPRAAGAMAFIGFVAGPFGTLCIMEATRRLPAMVSSVGFLAGPAVALVLATLLLGETIGPDLILGTALILAGVAIAAWPRRRVAA